MPSPQMTLEVVGSIKPVLPLVNTKQGILQIVIAICTCGIGSIIGFIEGIIYLTNSHEDFVKTNVENEKV
jgi:hypothetical protein